MRSVLSFILVFFLAFPLLHRNKKLIELPQVVHKR